MCEDGGSGGGKGHRQSERGRRVAGEGGGAVAANSREREDRTEEKGVSTREKRGNFGMRRRSREKER